MSNYSAIEVRGILARCVPGGSVSSCQIETRPEIERQEECFWRAFVKHREVTARDRGYLKAYVEMDGARFPAAGIRTADGQYVIPDKAVMSSVFDKQLVSLNGGFFELSLLGRSEIGLTYEA